MHLTTSLGFLAHQLTYWAGRRRPEFFGADLCEAIHDSRTISVQISVFVLTVYTYIQLFARVITIPEGCCFLLRSHGRLIRFRILVVMEVTWAKSIESMDMRISFIFFLILMRLWIKEDY